MKEEFRNWSYGWVSWVIMRADESTRFSGRCFCRQNSALKVVSHVPRNAPGHQTQEGNRTPQPDAGKTCFPGLARLGSGIWPAEVEDPWDSKASRWMGEGGAGLVRAGLVAWRQAQREFPQEKPDGRRIGVMGVVHRPSWPDGVRHRSPREIARSWKEYPPLWLLGCLPNLPMAQLAIEIGAKGPVETIRARPESRKEAIERIRVWLADRVDRVLWVEHWHGQALASVWQREGA